MISVARVDTEFLVNSQTTGDQGSPGIAGLTNGGFVVIWGNAQLFDAAGAKVGTEFPAVGPITGLTNGGFVVTWENRSQTLGDGSGSSIKAQVFDAAGAKVGTEFLVNTQTANDQRDSRITDLTNGGFVVTWEDFSRTLGDGSSSSIKAQVFDAAGVKVGTEFLVNTQTVSGQLHPAITGLPNGGFVVTWQDVFEPPGDTTGSGIKAQMFDAAGAKVGTEFKVNTQWPNAQFAPTITDLTNGGFVITWYDDTYTLGDNSSYAVKAQVFDAAGAKVGTEFLVNTQTVNAQENPTVTGLTNGDFVISWWDESGDNSGLGIKAQVFDAGGTKVGTEFLVNTETLGSQNSPTITGLTNGGFVISWADGAYTLGDSSGTSIKAQIFGFSSFSDSRGDFNGDGNGDILWGGDGGRIALWQMNGAQAHGDDIANVGPDWHIAGIGDFNGDHTSDILWRQENGTIALWQMNGTQVHGDSIGSVGPDWHIVGIGDFNGDAKSDILWRQDGGAIALWQMDGAQAHGDGIANVGPNWHIAGVGDFNGDGKSDILWRQDDGMIALWQMNGTQVHGDNVGAVGYYWQIVGIGDFNGDGKSDILWRQDNGTIALWQMNGAQVHGDNIGTVGPDWQVANIGDNNGDGKSDILWRQVTGQMAIWQMNGAQVQHVDSVANVGRDWQVAATHFDLI